MIGTATAGRNRPEWERVVGYFLNQVPLRVRVDARSDFGELVRRTQRVVLAALEHQDFPFNLMVERLRPVRDPSRPPIFQVMFIWDKSIEFSANQSESGHPFGASRPIEPLGDGAMRSALRSDFDHLRERQRSGSQYPLQRRISSTPRRSSGWPGTSRRSLAGIVDHRRPPRGRAAGPLGRGLERRSWAVTDGSGKDEARQLRPFHRLFEDQVERSPDATAVVFDGHSDDVSRAERTRESAGPSSSQTGGADRRSGRRLPAAHRPR